MDRTREQALVRRCRQGDGQAMEILLTHYEKPVYNAAFRMLGNPDDAADVTQTVFLKAFENILRYDPAYRFFSWIYRIAINESLDQLKRRRHDRPLVAEPAAETASPGESVQNLQLGDEIQAVLLELDPDLRAVIVLRYFTECDYREIGTTLGIPEKTVKSRLFSARRDMRRRLQRHGILSP